MNNILQLRNDCMFLKNYNRNNLIYSKLNFCPGSQNLMKHNFKVKNVLDLEINTGKCIKLLFLTENNP